MSKHKFFGGAVLCAAAGLTLCGEASVRLDVSGFGKTPGAPDGAVARSAAELVVDANRFETADVAAELQRIIDANPNRTIHLPDGTYMLERAIRTPAHPKRSVTLHLAAFAVLKAVPGWPKGEPLVRLGATHPANDILTVGSNYSFEGGVLDGSGIADGLSIDGGRETHVRDVSVKGTRIGLRIRHGANNGSSDADVDHVNIVCNSALDSVGVLVEGCDNSLTKMPVPMWRTRLAPDGATFGKSFAPSRLWIASVSRATRSTRSKPASNA